MNYERGIFLHLMTFLLGLAEKKFPINFRKISMESMKTSNPSICDVRWWLWIFFYFLVSYMILLTSFSKLPNSIEFFKHLKLGNWFKVLQNSGKQQKHISFRPIMASKPNRPHLKVEQFLDRPHHTKYCDTFWLINIIKPCTLY